MTLLQARLQYLHHRGYHLPISIDPPPSHRSTSLSPRPRELVGEALVSAGSACLPSVDVGTLTSPPHPNHIIMLHQQGRALVQVASIFQNLRGRSRLSPTPPNPGPPMPGELYRLVLSRPRRRRVHGRARKPDWSREWSSRHLHPDPRRLVQGRRAFRVWIERASP